MANDGRLIGATFIDIDPFRYTKALNRFTQEPPSCIFIALGCEQEIDGMAIFIDRTIEIFPFALYLDVGLIETPAP